MSANKITILDETDKTELEQNFSSINTDITNINTSITNIEQSKANTDLSNIEQSNILDKIGVLPIANGGTGATTTSEIINNLNILHPATAEAIGLSNDATPDDVFNALQAKAKTTNRGHNLSTFERIMWIGVI